MARTPSFLVLILLHAMFAQAGPPTLLVAADGSGDLRDLQSAVDSLPRATEPATIRIKPGTYKQRLKLGKTVPPLRFIGMGTRPEDTVITFDLSANSVVPPATQPVGTSGSASTTIESADFQAENVTFENSAGQVGQAVALKITGDRGVFRNCRFLGWQDTLCVDNNRQYFVDCYIEGRVDFIFGASTAVFDRCTIHSKNGGYITAARTMPEVPFGYVFFDCTLTGEGETAYLGRPWQWDRGRRASVTFIRSKVGPHIRPEGWNPWHLKDKQNTDPAAVTRYAEFGSTDLTGKPLDVSGRVPWAKQLTAEEAAGITPATVLAGTDGWNPGR